MTCYEPVPHHVSAVDHATAPERLHAGMRGVGMTSPPAPPDLERDGQAEVGCVNPMSWAGKYQIASAHPVLAGMRHLLEGLAAHLATAA